LLLNECLLLFISLSIQSGNFWIHPRSVTSYAALISLAVRVTSNGGRPCYIGEGIPEQRHQLE